MEYLLYIIIAVITVVVLGFEFFVFKVYQSRCNEYHFPKGYEPHTLVFLTYRRAHFIVFLLIPINLILIIIFLLLIW